MTPQDLVKRNVRLVSLPEICMQVQALADSPHTTADDIAEVVGKDTALTARLLKLVNSAFFSETLEVAETAPFWTESWFFELLKLVLGGLVLLALALGFLRPLFRNLSQAGAVVEEQQRLARLEARAAAEADRRAAVKAGPSTHARSPEGIEHLPQIPTAQPVIRSTR